MLVKGRPWCIGGGNNYIHIETYVSWLYKELSSNALFVVLLFSSEPLVSVNVCLFDGNHYIGIGCVLKRLDYLDVFLNNCGWVWCQIISIPMSHWHWFHSRLTDDDVEVQSHAAVSDGRPVGGIYWPGIDLIPAWISNYVHYYVLNEITYSLQNVNVQTLTFGNR